MIKKNRPQLKRKPRILKKSGMSLSRSKVLRVERVRLEGLVADLNQSRDDLGVKIKQQADELTAKNGQLRNGSDKQIRSEEQIYVLTEAIEATSEGIFIIDAKKPNFPIVYANESFLKTTGYTKSEILGRNYFLFYGVDADTSIANEIKRTIRKGKSFRVEVVNFKKDGKKYWNSLRITPVRDSRGIIAHYIGIQTDVTLIREKEFEIGEQREELLHVTRVGKLAEFVSSLAHEISQPLTAILSYAQAAQRILADRDPKLHEILQYIINDDQRAADVIQRLRSLLKKSAPEIKPLDINALINDTVMIIATDANIRNDELKIELDSNLPLVNGDRVQLQQVLLNLISNSFDALDGSHEKREILIRTSLKNAGTIMVEVKDSGCGIPAQNIPKLFTHFFTSKSDGLGMGLSISRSIIESHGGRLDVKNNPDRGATFYFTIPTDKMIPNE